MTNTIFYWVWGGGLEQNNIEDWEQAKTIADILDSTNLSFHTSVMIGIREDNRNTTDVPDLFPTIPYDQGCQYVFQFSFTDIIWDGRETVKS